MKSLEYKRQFLEFLRSAYPDGFPEGKAGRILLCTAHSDGSVNKYEFEFDKEDYELFLKGKKTKKSTTKFFSEALTSEDIDFLKSLKISVDDVEKQEC